MAGPRDDTYESLPARLSELFGALETTLRSVAEKGGEPAGHDLVLEMVRELVSPALMEEAEAASSSYTATWYLAHLTATILQRLGIPDHGSGSGPYRHLHSVIRKLNDALADTPPGYERDQAEQLEEVRVLVQALPQAILGAVDETLRSQQDQAAQKLGELESAIRQLLQTAPSAVESARYEHSHDCGHELEELETLITALPQALSAALTQSLPGPVAQAVVDAITGAQDKAGANIAALRKLAAIPLNAVVDSPADGIGFLAAVLNALTDAGQVPTKVPPEVIAQLSILVAGVLNNINPAAPPTIAELNQMNILKQGIAPYLQEPAVVGGN
jgi:hypothetical protein